MKKKYTLYLLIFVCALTILSCQSAKQPTPASSDAVLVLPELGYPQAMLHNGRYYLTIQALGGRSVELYSTTDLCQMEKAEHRVIIAENDTLTHFWSPEIYRIDNRWYLYFEGDDGNTDNHHLYVMECSDDNPMTGQFVTKGVIDTHAEWNYGIHPSLLQLPSGELYLFWSGWPKRRNETETQCIYIARMENPWTTSSDRVMISQPEYEWERQWINPDGNRSAYPIYVNENPEAFLSPDSNHVVVLYSASGIWTEYTSLGMLTAPAQANLLDTAVWTKRQEPVMQPDTINRTCINNVYLVATPDGQQTQLLYELKRRENGNIIRDTYVRPIRWTPEGEPMP